MKMLRPPLTVCDFFALSKRFRMGMGGGEGDGGEHARNGSYRPNRA
jgi:hypothetical protein